MNKYPLIILLVSLFNISPAFSAEKHNNYVMNSVTASPSMVIQINSATLEELTALKGIGEAKAKAIIQYRTTNGKFNSVDDLIKVKGIGASVIKQNQGLLTL